MSSLQRADGHPAGASPGPVPPGLQHVSRSAGTRSMPTGGLLAEGTVASWWSGARASEAPRSDACSERERATSSFWNKPVRGEGVRNGGLPRRGGEVHQGARASTANASSAATNGTCRKRTTLRRWPAERQLQLVKCGTKNWPAAERQASFLDSHFMSERLRIGYRLASRGTADIGAIPIRIGGVSAISIGFPLRRRVTVLKIGNRPTIPSADSVTP